MLLRYCGPILLCLTAACGPGERPAGEPAAGDEQAASFGGALDADSIRAARLQLLRQIDQSGSYLGFMLADVDSVIRRWPERRADPVRVHLPESRVVGYQPAHHHAVQDAFRRWERVGTIPVYFEFSDSARAEVHVRWIRQFEVQRTGQADITWNREGWIQRATLTLATHSPAGWELPEEAVHTVALHEIGHLLGLGHSDHPRDVMYPSTEIHDITARDRVTARLLYALPTGSLKLPD
jgi:hypothetical protein